MVIKKNLSNYAASKKPQTRLARDKNRYKASSHNADGLGYDILIKSVVFWLEVEGFIYTDKNAIYRKEEGRGEQTRIKPYSKFIECFKENLQTLPQKIIAFEDTNPIIYQEVTKKKIVRESQLRLRRLFLMKILLYH